jgi:hypothetical protein
MSFGLICILIYILAGLALSFMVYKNGGRGMWWGWLLLVLTVPAYTVLAFVKDKSIWTKAK